MNSPLLSRTSNISEMGFSYFPLSAIYKFNFSRNNENVFAGALIKAENLLEDIRKAKRTGQGGKDEK